MKHLALIAALLPLAALTVHAEEIEDRIELDTLRIISNEELPGVLYIVPWKDIEPLTVNHQRLNLHNFFGDLYEPILPRPVVAAQRED